MFVLVCSFDMQRGTYIFHPFGSKQKLLDIEEDIAVPNNDPVEHFVLHN